MQIETKLPAVGTTIFTVMSQLAIEHKAVNRNGKKTFQKKSPRQ